MTQPPNYPQDPQLNFQQPDFQPPAGQPASRDQNNIAPDNQQFQHQQISSQHQQPLANPVLKEQRTHPLSPFVDSWVAIVAALFVFGRDFVTEGFHNPLEDLPPYFIFVLIPILVIIIIKAVITWAFTRFVIDDEQVRVEYNFISHSSQRIAFSKIQSVDVNQRLVPRLFGLATLDIDVGADSSKTIKYLTRQKAYELREYLMARASRKETRLATSHFQASSVFSDQAASDQVLVKVTVGRLFASMLLTSGTVIFVLVFFAALIVTQLVPEVRPYGIILLPYAAAGVLGFAAQIPQQFNFTITRSNDGLKISYGLTDLRSQAVPVHRIQGVMISQPLLWRLTGWYRVDIDVLGKKIDLETKTPNSLLLPVGTIEEAHRLLKAVLPDFDLERIEMHDAPKRARWLHPFNAHTFKWGFDEYALVTQGYLLTRQTHIVPHARVQGVLISQGPLKRLAGLANVYAENTPGPVNAVCRLVDERIAREIALEETNRMRHARQVMLAAKSADNSPSLEEVPTGQEDFMPQPTNFKNDSNSSTHSDGFSGRNFYQP